MKMPSLNSWILLMLHALLTNVNLGATLECICTTEECTKTNKILCTANNMCYVQKMADITSDITDYKIIRGCIDESMPLLCENRRPEGYTGAWPVLHCCQHDWCNNEIIPTDPPWSSRNIDDKQDVDTQTDLDSSEDTGNKWNSKTRQRDNNDLSSHNKKQLEFNILYIAVPLAGACVMLAIVIFSLYLLKVKRHTKSYNSKPQVVSNIYKQKIPLMLTTDAKRTDAIYPKVTHNFIHLSAPTKSHDLSHDTGSYAQQPMKCLVHDSSEISGGSETKLIV